MTNKTKKYWCVLPYDESYSVQYCDTKQQAELLAQSYDCGAHISEIEQRVDIVERKNKQTAMKGYRL
jgi:hypothetical protein